MWKYHVMDIFLGFLSAKGQITLNNEKYVLIHKKNEISYWKLSFTH